jgi:hypothetical protein
MGSLKKDYASINKTFARVMRILTWSGLIVLVVFGVLYLLGVNNAYDRSLVMQHWDKPASRFWPSVSGRDVEGYAWFLSYIPNMDSFAMTGIVLLMLTPLITILFVVWRMRGIYLMLLIVLIAEFLFSVLRPLL